MYSLSNRRRLLAAGSAIALLVAGPVYARSSSAEQASTPPEGQATSAAPAGSAPGAAAAPAGGLEEVVVTAQKHREDIQKTPAAVTAVSGQVMVEKGITSLIAAEDVVPGSRFHAEGNTTQVFLRGVGTNLDFANVQPSVAFNFNGVFIPREGTSVGLFDVDRFEALPGPQGTLYGRSAIGGTINVGFKRPEFNNSFSDIIVAGNYDLVHNTAVGNFAPSDKLAVRGVVDYAYHKGYMDSGADSQDDLALRLSALYQPNDKTTIYWWGYSADKYGSPPNIINKGSVPTYDSAGNLTGFRYDEMGFLHSNPFDDTRKGALAATAPFGSPTAATQHYHNWATGGQLDFKLGGNMTLTYIPSYLHLNSVLNVWWLGSLPAFKHDEYDQTTHELRLAGDTGRLNWLVGLYGYHTLQQGQFILGSLNGPNGPSIPGTPFPFYGSHVLGNRLQGAAVFGQATYKITNDLRVTAGSRYGVDDTKAHGISLQDGVSPYHFDHTVYRYDFKLGAQYDLTSRVMLYVQYQTGYQPATFNEVVPTPGHSNLVETATLRSVAGGFKARFFNNTLQVNDEAFYSIYNNYQIQAYNSTQIYNPIFNAKEITIPGDQLDVVWRPTVDDRFNLSVSYIHDRNKNFVTPSGVSYNGFAGPYAADWTIGVGASHDFQLSSGYIRVSADSRYESTWWGDYVHNLGVRQDPYAKVNADVTYYSDDGRWSFGVWGRNLSNQVTIGAVAASGFPGPATAYLDDPMTFGIRAQMKY